MSAKQFAIELDKWFEDEVEEKIVLVAQKIGMEVLRRLIMKSPVNTGRFRGNWSVAIGSPDTSVKASVDKPGQATIAAGSAVINGLSEPQAIWLTNNLPYALRLENGWSQQAPAGIVAVTVTEIEAFFARVE